MKIEDIIAVLESFAPKSYQEAYDNTGISTGETKDNCTGVLVSLDCTEDVVQEAIIKKCNLIVSHHPLIFRPIRQILADNGVGKALIRAIKAGISIYSIHTNLDNILSGVNTAIADKLKLINRKVLLAKADNPGVGSGMAGDLSEPLSENQILARLKEQFGVPVIRHSPLTGRTVTRVAVCGGAGSFLIPNALDEKVGFFVSSDIKYHEFFGAEGKMVIADIGHFESEQFTIDLIHDIILEKFPNFAVLKSGTKTNPVNYYI